MGPSCSQPASANRHTSGRAFSKLLFMGLSLFLGLALCPWFSLAPAPLRANVMHEMILKIKEFSCLRYNKRCAMNQVDVGQNLPPCLTDPVSRSEEHTSELQSRENLVCRLLLENKNITNRK